MIVKDLLEGTAVLKRKMILEAISPLLLHGFDARDQAETRAPSIKGVLRYWWRALQSETEGLLSKESRLFGSIGRAGAVAQKSPLMISVPRIAGSSKYPLRPQRGRGSGTATGIKAGTTFAIEFSVLRKNAGLLDEYVDWFEFALLVSGFGQRARRGYGSLQSTNAGWGTVEEYRTVVEEKIVQLTGKRWHELKKIGDTEHPVLRNMWLGTSELSVEKALLAIGEASSRAKASAGIGEYLLGSISSRRRGIRRLASPLHVTVRRIDRAYYPIVTEIHPKQHPPQEYRDQRRVFLQRLGVEDNG
jgi:CRISPR-associated protein Cmr1